MLKIFLGANGYHTFPSLRTEVQMLQNRPHFLIFGWSSSPLMSRSGTVAYWVSVIFRPPIPNCVCVFQQQSQQQRQKLFHARWGRGKNRISNFHWVHYKYFLSQQTATEKKTTTKIDIDGEKLLCGRFDSHWVSSSSIVDWLQHGRGATRALTPSMVVE